MALDWSDFICMGIIADIFLYGVWPHKHDNY